MPSFDQALQLGKVGTEQALELFDSLEGVDANTVLGVMDFKGMKQPYFFILRRDTQG